MPGLTEPTSRHDLIAPSDLHGMVAILAQRLDCRDVLAVRLFDSGSATTHGNAIEMNGAGPAKADAASKFRFRKSKKIAHIPKDWHIAVHVQSLLGSV